MKSQAFETQDPKSLQSPTRNRPEYRFRINRLPVLHGRGINLAEASHVNLSTNAIESLMAVLRQVCRNVKR
jgi:hypothetical protein